MISFKDHSLALFGVWYEGVMFAPEGEFLELCSAFCDLFYRFTNAVHGSITGIHGRRCSDNCFR